MADPAVKLLGFRLVRPLDQLEQAGAGDERERGCAAPLEKAREVIPLGDLSLVMVQRTGGVGWVDDTEDTTGIRRDEPRFSVDQDGAQLVAVEVKLGGGGHSPSVDPQVFNG